MRETKRKLPTAPEFLLKKEKASSVKWPKLLNQWQIGTKKGSFLPHAQNNKGLGVVLKLLKIRG